MTEHCDCALADHTFTPQVESSKDETDHSIIQAYEYERMSASIKET